MAIPELEQDLPEFRDHYLQIFNSRTHAVEIRRRNRAESGISITETMDLLAKLLRRYQMTYWAHHSDPNVVQFPFLFKQPKPGTQIRNIDTREVYTIDQIIANRETGDWDGRVKLETVTHPPKWEMRQSLAFLDHDNLVRFDHETPEALPNLVGANLEGGMKNPPPLEPTVTWMVDTVEPGGLGRAFDPRKELKPRLREQTKDPLEPGYTVSIFGQSFDNILQFDCWTNDSRSSERLYIWFEQFLREYTWVFLKYGVQQMFFWQRLRDRTSATWRQYFPVRTMQWYFRTENLTAIYDRDILRLDINIDIESALPSLSEGWRWIADQPVSGVLTHDAYRDLFYRSGDYLFGDVILNQ